MATPRHGFARARAKAAPRAPARVLAVLGLALLAAGCGFHLRGQAEYPFQTIFLNSPSTSPITTDLRRALDASGSAKLVPAADKAQVVLDVNSVDDEKHILSLSSGGKVFEFLLTKRVVFRVHDADGNDWLPTSEIIIRRTYTYSDTETLAKEYEEQRLWRDMQTDAVQQVVRRLQAAKKPVA